MLLFGDTGSSLTFSYTSPHLPFRNAKALSLHDSYSSMLPSHSGMPTPRPTYHSLLFATPYSPLVYVDPVPLSPLPLILPLHTSTLFTSTNKKSHSPLTAPRPRRDPPPHLPTSPVPTQGYRQPPLHFPTHSSCPRVPCPHSGISTIPSPLTQHSYPHLPTHTPCPHSGISITSSPTLHSPLPSPSNHSSSPVFQ